MRTHYSELYFFSVFIPKSLPAEASAQVDAFRPPNYYYLSTYLRFVHRLSSLVSFIQHFSHFSY
jgi:hypothetical protein